jgi:hypothetical protein
MGKNQSYKDAYGEGVHNPHNPVRGGTTAQPATTTTVPKLTQYARQDWGKIFQLSMKFYAAQMSGKLPSNHPVRWRYSQGFFYLVLIIIQNC